MIVDCGI
jgi:hypothetical protein